MARDEFLSFGFKSWRGNPVRFQSFHRHNEVELNYVETGSITLLFAGAASTMSEGQFLLLWGPVPHKIVGIAKGTIMHWLTVPLAWFLQWQLPAKLTQPLLKGRAFSEVLATGTDLAMFERWHHDLESGAVERRKLVLLEAEVRLRRLALDAPARSRPATGERLPDLSKVEKMAAYIAEHYTEAVCVADVAAAAGLHPDYAVTVFRKTCGMGIVAYMTQHRISHAQRLLATTDMKIIDAALASGFGSASRFYAVFEKICGQSPRAYRASMTG